MEIDLACLKVTGKEAFNFLQGMLTCDVRKSSNIPLEGAFCQQQGRVIATLSIQSITQGFQLTLPAELAQKTLQILQKFARFSEVSLESCPTNKKLDLLASILQERAVVLLETSEKFTPHDLNYHQLGLISFDKGCYLGQEIIARMHYLGKLKKHLERLTSTTREDEENAGELVNTAYNPSNNMYEKLVVKKITTARITRTTV